MDELIMRVSSRSDSQSVAAKLAHAMYQERPVKLRMIGAGAVNQAIKALAIAQSMAKKPPNDLNLAYRFSFDTVEFDNGERSALVVDVLTL